MGFIGDLVFTSELDKLKPKDIQMAD
jgi:periodic tryptophan protein 1